MVTDTYERRCAITGERTLPVLETVESDLTFRVSKSIERVYSNGKIYYVLDGKKIATPARPEHRPDSEALDWHANSVLRP